MLSAKGLGGPWEVTTCSDDNGMFLADMPLGLSGVVNSSHAMEERRRWRCRRSSRKLPPRRCPPVSRRRRLAATARLSRADGSSLPTRQRVSGGRISLPIEVASPTSRRQRRFDTGDLERHRRACPLGDGRISQRGGRRRLPAVVCRSRGQGTAETLLRRRL